MKVTLLLVAALGIVLGHWLGVTRRLFVILAPVSIGGSAAQVPHLADTSHRSWITDRLLSGGRRMVAACALLVWGVAVGILAVQSLTVAPPAQTIAPPGSAADAEFYLKRGENFGGVHDYDQAIADYNTAIRLKPDYAEAYNDRGFAYYMKGGKAPSQRAIADFTRAIELRPNYPKAYNSRGVMYMAGGYARAKAIADFDRAIELKPDFRYAYINRANARLPAHPWLALDDFHRAGRHPERTAAMLGGVILLVVAGIAMVWRTRIRGARRSV
jgi:hypothetical protein